MFQVDFILRIIMARAGITYDDVVDAALTIQQNGETPSIDKVRTLLGGTGSFTTISKFLQVWRHQVVHGTFKKEPQTATPEIVKTAVERVWHEMREQTNNEILSIKTETKKAIDEAEGKARHTEENYNALKSKHDELLGYYQAERAEKELLLLDMKKLREEHVLLQERATALETRYADMQALASQHLKDLSSSHQNEVARLEETCKVQAQNHAQLVNEIRDHSEKMRQEHIVIIDNLKIENKKSQEAVTKLQSEMREQLIITKKLESDLKAMQIQRDGALDRLNEQDQKWSYFDNKTLVSDQMINKIYDAPAFDILISKFNMIVEGSLEKKFIEMMEENAKLFDSSKHIMEKTKDK